VLCQRVTACGEMTRNELRNSLGELGTIWQRGDIRLLGAVL
jgi:hypothetical protein